MRKTILGILICLLYGGVSSGQEFQGEATYFSKTSIPMNFEGREMSEERKKQIMQRMKEANEKTYVLTFDRLASIYSEEERLEQPGNEGRGGIRWGGMGASQGDYYKNIKEENYVTKNDLFGKIFLVQDKLPKLVWKLGSETKKIGEYTAFRATATRTVKRPERREIFRRGGDSDTLEIPEKEIEIEAWYTPEIPVNQGPGEYWGLPGLILMVNDDVTSIICSKIILNPKEKIKIEPPTKGKVVSQVEYDEISTEKMKEMRENFRSRNGRGGNRQ